MFSMLYHIQRFLAVKSFNNRIFIAQVVRNKIKYLGVVVH
jgi:hypothetical protein